jgi:hypothetical protein
MVADGAASVFAFLVTLDFVAADLAAAQGSSGRVSGAF